MAQRGLDWNARTTVLRRNFQPILSPGGSKRLIDLWKREDTWEDSGRRPQKWKGKEFRWYRVTASSALQRYEEQNVWESNVRRNSEQGLPSIEIPTSSSRIKPELSKYMWGNWRSIWERPTPTIRGMSQPPSPMTCHQSNHLSTSWTQDPQHGAKLRTQ